MAEHKSESENVPATPTSSVVKHARIELPEDDYQRLKDAAKRYHISVSAYIRQAVMERIERDESKR